MKTIRRWLNGIEEGVISLLMVTITLLVVAEVVARFVFNTGINWAQEATLHLSAWMVLFGASYGVKVGCHIGVDAFVRLLPRHIRRLVSFVAVIGSIVYCALFSWGAWFYLKKVYKIGIKVDDLHIAKWLAHSILLIGLILLGIRFLQLAWQILTDKADGFAFADEAKDAMHLVDTDEQGSK
ncbi:TRAP transporter small permease [Insolitispirillum peregrinum]|uniref:TRAP transporter small permease protein n=1 Tax=Insolitispirillum peregrinum TaxID=80876 RepID=A0A1N7NG99_9PROT|nr:TRAP transporter small permease [Insolitispirillum peregrinum]SIS97377.1 C4-dicarboxylate transporter, DctQ subunit [Insolitispirillum peregrinum]